MQDLRHFSLIRPVFTLDPLPPRASNRPGSNLMTLMTLVKDSTINNRLSQQIIETNNSWQNARRAADIAGFRGFGPTARSLRVCIYFLAVCKSRRRTFLYAFRLILRLILVPWGGSGAGDWLRHAVRRCLSPVLSRTAGTGTFAAKSMPLRSQSPSPGPCLIAVALSGSETDCQKLWAHPIPPPPSWPLTATPGHVTMPSVANGLRMFQPSWENF